MRRIDVTGWRSFYSRPTNMYHVPGPFYSGPGHHGVDFAVGSHGAVPAYFSGRCALNGRSDALGNFTVFRLGDGSYAGYAHCLTGTRRDVGDSVSPGDTLYLAAGHDDVHGTAWTGPHCHTTRSPHDVNGVWDGNVVDPWPFIRAAVSAAGGTSTTTTTHKTGVRTTTVRAGEGGQAVADRTGVSYATLRRLNPSVRDWSGLRLGQTVRIG